KNSRQRAHETDSDVRALTLCEDAEALVSGLTKMTMAGRMPRRWSAELEHGSSHPSLARRLHAIRRVAAIPVVSFDETLVVATTRPTALVVLDHDGVAWVEARSATDRDPEVLRQTARSRWAVPYTELVELRVRASWWAGASLVARDRTGASRAVRIAPGEVAALQRKLDAVEPLLAHDTLVIEPPAVAGRFTAMTLALAVALTWARLLAHVWRTSQPMAVVAHLLGGAPVLWAAMLALAAVLLSLPGWTLRGAGALLVLAAVLAGPGVKLYDTLVTM